MPFFLRTIHAGLYLCLILFAEVTLMEDETMRRSEVVILVSTHHEKLLEQILV